MAVSLLKKLKYQSYNAHNRRSGETSNNIFEAYKNYVMPHGCHSYQKSSTMDMETICAYTLYQHVFP